MLRAGFTLADIPGRVTWRALKARVEHTAHGDALYRTVHGDIAAWSDQEHLIANLIDLVALLVWFKTEDGRKNRNRPKMTRRPGFGEHIEGTSLGSGGVPVEEFQGAWAAAVQRQLDEEKAITEVGDADETGEAVVT